MVSLFGIFGPRLKSLVPRDVKNFCKKALGVPSMELGLLNMRRNGFSPEIVVDIGAFRGEYTRMCKRVFPNAHILMIEPQKARQRDLMELQGEYTNVAYTPALLGPAQREAVGFYESGSASSVLSVRENGESPTVYLPMTTLDLVTENTPFAKPDLVKLDVQGYELEVLQGGKRVLASELL